MPSFAVRHPYLLIVVCLFVCVLGLTSVARMPVDMFPPINIPVRNAASADRSGYYGYVRTFFYAGKRNRSYGIAVDDRRQPD